ncbi:MAG: type II secretion system F family protein [Planctomycetota bacterium]
MDLTFLTSLSTSTLVIGLTAFLGVMTLAAALIFTLNDFSPKAADERLQVLTGKKRRDEEALSRDELLREGMNGVSGRVGDFAAKFGDMALLFEQADSPIKPEMFFIISVVSAVIGAAIGLIAKAPVPLIPVCALLTGVLPLMWIFWRRGRRFKAFAQQLPDAMELIGRALRSGHSLASGLHVVVDEMPAPISEEFGKAYEEQNLGVPLEQALKSMLRRMPNMDLKFFVTAVAIQRQAGGDLSEILDKIGHIIRERFKIMGQVMALTGEGRISGVVLMALPVLIFFAVYYLNPDYLMTLFEKPLGIKMLAVAGLLQIVGAFAIKKIVDIKI